MPPGGTLLPPCRWLLLQECLQGRQRLHRSLPTWLAAFNARPTRCRRRPPAGRPLLLQLQQRLPGVRLRGGGPAGLVPLAIPLPLGGAAQWQRQRHRCGRDTAAAARLGQCAAAGCGPTLTSGAGQASVRPAEAAPVASASPQRSLIFVFDPRRRMAASRTALLTQKNVRRCAGAPAPPAPHPTGHAVRPAPAAARTPPALPSRA